MLVVSNMILAYFLERGYNKEYSFVLNDKAEKREIKCNNIM